MVMQALLHVWFNVLKASCIYNPFFGEVDITKISTMHTATLLELGYCIVIHVYLQVIKKSISLITFFLTALLTSYNEYTVLCKSLEPALIYVDVQTLAFRFFKVTQLKFDSNNLVGENYGG